MKNRLLLTALATTSVLMGACAVVPAHDPRHRHELIVSVAPPPPIYENPGYPPYAGHIWITGYWNWANVRYVWVPGRWEAPRPGYLWVPHRWERDGSHWRPHGGTWERDARPPHAQPSPPAPHVPPSPPVRQFERPDRAAMERQGPPPGTRTAPERGDDSRARSDTTPRPAPGFVPGDGRDSRRPTKEADRQQVERPSAPPDLRSAPEQRDESRAKPDATSRPERRDATRRRDGDD